MSSFPNPKDIKLLTRMDSSKVGWHRTKESTSSQKLLQADYNVGGEAISPHNCLVEAGHAHSLCKYLSGSKARLVDVYNGLTTSKELLKLLIRICHIEKQNSTSLSLVSALKFELDRACIHFNKFVLDQKTNRSEVDILLKQFMEEKVVWKIKEQERIHSALTSMSGELEIEKRLRKQTERLNKKLGKELAETKASLLRATKELESEKRAREILEQVCDELARGIGEDKAEVEELKRQSAKVRQEVEKEREMLQLADVLREERVQMKLSEAKYQYEEKNALVEKLKNELETFLKSKTGEEPDDGGSPCYDKIKALEKYLRETLPGSYQCQGNKKEDKDTVNKEDEDEGDDSDDSDLHSIELNMDDINKSFHWNETLRNGSKRNSVDKSKGRTLDSEKIKKPIISSELKLADGIEWKFTNDNQESSDAFDPNGCFEFTSQSWKKDREDEMERYNMIKDLRDNIVSGSKMSSSQGLANPTPNQNLGQQSVSSKDANGVTCPI